MMKYVVVGIDESDHTQHLLDWTETFASDIAAHVTLVHAVPRAQLWAVAGVMLDSNRYVDDLRQRLETKLVVPLRARGTAVDLRVEIGDPARTLVETAKRLDAEMIIVGASHGVMHDIVGSHLSHRLEHISDIPVLVVPRASHVEPARA